MLNGFDYLYMPTDGSVNMAGKRPSYDAHLLSILSLWHIECGGKEFNAKELVKYMQESGLGNLNESQTRRMTHVEVAARLSFWAKAAKVDGLTIVQKNPYRYKMVVDE